MTHLTAIGFEKSGRNLTDTLKPENHEDKLEFESWIGSIGLDSQLVVYNRVPKCGSTTTLDVIRYIKRRNKFTVFNDIAPKMKVKLSYSKINV